MALLSAGCNVFAPALPVDARQPTDFRLPGGDVTVSSRLVSNFAFLTVTVNDTGPSTFILDTGASSAIVSPRIADLFPQSLTGQTTISAGGVGPEVSSRFFRVDRLALGSIVFENFEAAVLDLDPALRNFPFQVDGILGLPLFAALVLSLDYPNSRVRVRTSGSPETDHCSVLPLTVLSEKVVSLPVKVGDRDGGRRVPVFQQRLRRRQAGPSEFWRPGVPALRRDARPAAAANPV